MNAHHGINSTLSGIVIDSNFSQSQKVCPPLSPKVGPPIYFTPEGMSIQTSDLHSLSEF